MDPTSAADISVIIPSFNNADYLERCVRSAFALPQLKVEVIVVDDGSTDATPEVVAGLRVEFPSLIYLRKENGGLSSARNHGIRHASGRYLALLDADDELFPVDLSAWLATGDDILRIGVEDVALNGKVSVHADARARCGGPAYLTESCRQRVFYAPSPAYLYRRQWFAEQGLRFAEGLLHEDMLFSVQALLAAESVSCVPVSVYKYIRRPNSITASSSKAHCHQRIRSLAKIQRHLIEIANAHPEIDISYWIVNVMDHAYEVAYKVRGGHSKLLALPLVLNLFLRYRSHNRRTVAKQEAWRIRQLLTACLGLQS